MQDARLAAVAFDRPGMHNPCMVVIVSTPSAEITNGQLPAGVDIAALIRKAYAAIGHS